MSKPDLLITGASGYLGTHLLTALAKNNKYDLTALDIRTNSKFQKSTRFVETDLNNIDLLSKTLEGVDLICHCASLGKTTRINRPGGQPTTNNQFLITNIKGTQNLYKQAKEKGVNKIVLTSSIEVLSLELQKENWPVNERYVCWPDDSYGVSKNIQEIIARSFADSGSIQTLALRPCAFFPVNDPDRGFRLTGTHAMVEDIANAHVAAVEVLLDEKRASDLNRFEAIFITNKLPYQNSDKNLIDSRGKMKKLIRKYWPDHAEYIFDLGYKQAFFPCVYDISKAKRILNWEPAFNFDQWLIYCKEKNLDFQSIKKQNQVKKSWNSKLKRIFFKLKKKL